MNFPRWLCFYEFHKKEYNQYHRKIWHPHQYSKPSIRLSHEIPLSIPQIKSSAVLNNLVFTRHNTGSRFFYTHTDHIYHSMPETVEHKNIRLKNREHYYGENSMNNDDKTVRIMH